MALSYILWQPHGQDMDSNDLATTSLATMTPVSAFLRVGHQSTSVLNEKDDPRLCACVRCNIVLMVVTVPECVPGCWH